MRNFSTAETNILNDLDIDVQRGRMTDRSPDPARQPRRGGILPDVDISISDEGQMVVDDNRIVDDAEGESPYSAKHRKPARPGFGEFDAQQLLSDHIASASHPGEALEQIEQWLAALRRQYGVSQMSLNRNRNQFGVWSGGPGRAYGRTQMSVDERETPEEREAMREFRGESKSKDHVVQVLQQVLDNLRSDMKVADENGVPTAQSEAAGLLETMIGTLILQRKRRSAQKPQDADRDDAENVGDDFGKAYGKPSTAFAAMSLRQPQRPQSDAEANRIVDEMFSRKWSTAAAK